MDRQERLPAIEVDGTQHLAIQAITHGFGQDMGWIGLGQEMDSFPQFPVVSQQIHAVAAGVNDLQTGSLFSQLPGQLPTGHPFGHHHICQ